ncbi:MAG: YeiH family protein [Candidatus Omnitrophica bacterium]|nr:YeiH family protein [Candidatus Omnitrophota bacterium]
MGEEKLGKQTEPEWKDCSMATRQRGQTLNLLKERWQGIAVAVLVGLLGYGLKVMTKSPIADPLLAAMIIGVIAGTGIGKESKLRRGFVIAPVIFIPIGVIFYAAKNLNFTKFARVETSMVVLLIIIMVVYFAVILLMGKFLRQRKQITYLTATGSAICGASAIAIVSPAVDAEPDDVSISLLAVALTAGVGLFMFFPFLAILFDMTNRDYGLLSGSVLQFTGFVKAAVGTMPFLKIEIPAKELASLALSVKAVRYIGLLIAIPLFSSLVKKKFYIPWFLWAFLGAGLLGSWISATNEILYTKALVPFIRPIYNISWSIAMAAIGLNVDVKRLSSNNGIKALIMAFAGFLAAIAVFFIGVHVIQSF